MFRKKNKETVFPYPGKSLKVGSLPYGEALIRGKDLDSAYYGATITFWYGKCMYMWINNPVTTMVLSKVEVDPECSNVIRVYSDELVMTVMEDDIVHVSFNK